METLRSGAGSLNSAQYCVRNGLNFKDRFLRLDIRSAGHGVLNFEWVRTCRIVSTKYCYWILFLVHFFPNVFARRQFLQRKITTDPQIFGHAVSG